MAALLGASLGPLGVAWTLNTRIDPVLTGTLYLGASLEWGGRGMVLGLLFCSAYNVARVRYRNARLEAGERAAARRAAETRPAWRAAPRSAPEVIEAVALVTPPAEAEPVSARADLAEDAPAVGAVASLPEALSQANAPLPVEEPAPATEPAAPKRRGRPKGSRKAAA